jgi:PST family polysaccharide transporter
MLSFGGHITAFNALIYALRNFDNVIVGMVLGAAPLGLYSKAYNLLMLPIRQINNPLTSVALPALSKLQNDPARFKSFFLNMCSVASVISIPIVAYSYVDADIIIRILLGEKWMSATETFRLLAPASLAGAVNFIPGLLCVSRGKADLQLRWAVWTAPLIIVGFCIGVMWGINGVAASFSITYPITFLIFIFMACKGSPVNVSDIGKSLSMPLLAAISSATLLIWIKMILGTQHLILIARPFAHFSIFLILFLSIMALFKQGRVDIERLFKLRQNFQNSMK